MNEMKLPEELCGPWENALVLTYGADLEFFENALWRQFGTRCRNKIILADGRHYLEACRDYARTGLVRYLNQRYIGEGIFVPQAAHAKLILLTNEKQGRLLVGSGNLSLQGYASGGELFGCYEYQPDKTQDAGAFLAVRELMEALMECQYISSAAEKRVQYLLEHTPWLYYPAPNSLRPVRHNLVASFLNQVGEAVNGEAVEELWVMSPFFDEQAIALRRLLEVIAPKQATLLVQRKRTSARPEFLREVVDDYHGRCRVCPFTKSTDIPYIHAKMYLIKLRDRALCFYGSPNLSQVAMLLSVPLGNLEIANLLTGSRDAFDYIVDALQIEPAVTRLDDLDLSIESRPKSFQAADTQWYLRSGEWSGDRLYLSFNGILPALAGVSLIIGDMPFSVEVIRHDDHAVELRLTKEAIEQLGRAIPVHVQWDRGGQVVASNPVFVCNRSALYAALEVSEEGDTLGTVGDLALDDVELERLLGELDAALIIDRQSVWSLVGKRPPQEPEEDEDAPMIPYDEVDYAMLQRHPKFQQYRLGIGGGPSYSRSRLQIILNAITDHFHGLVAQRTAQHTAEIDTSQLDETDQSVTEAENEQNATEGQARRRTMQQRIRRLLKNFITRYLAGVRSTAFQEVAGFEVMTQNYAIFSHILWRLFGKDWVEPDFIIDAFCESWRGYWGDGTQSGYFATLTPANQHQVREWLNPHYVDATLISALYYSTQLSMARYWEERLFTLRNIWRSLLADLPFHITSELLETAWHLIGSLLAYNPPRPTAISNELTRLARFETSDSVLRSIESRFAYPRLTCSFIAQAVFRPHLGRKDSITCLVIRRGDALPNREVAIAILEEWMQLEARDYYRLEAPDTRRILYYEAREKAGIYWAPDRNEMIDLGPVVPRRPKWQLSLAHMRSLAAKLDSRLTLNAVAVPSNLSRR